MNIDMYTSLIWKTVTSKMLITVAPCFNTCTSTDTKQFIVKLYVLFTPFSQFLFCYSSIYILNIITVNMQPVHKLICVVKSTQIIGMGIGKLLQYFCKRLRIRLRIRLQLYEIYISIPWLSVSLQNYKATLHLSICNMSDVLFHIRIENAQSRRFN